MVRIGVKPHQLGATLGELRSAWREAEEAGFESVWVFDHLNRAEAKPCLEALALLSALAAETSRVRIGVMVLNAGLRHPAYAAAVAATIDQLSSGRLEIGVGAGSRFGVADLAALGLRAPSLQERAGLLDEYCQVLRLLWSGDKVDFRGRHFRLAGAHLGAEPAQSSLPLIVGGGSRPILRVAARHGDEWNLSLPTGDPEEFRRRSAFLDEMVRATGRTVLRSAQVYLSGLPDGDLEAMIGQLAEAGAERLTLVLDPPYEKGSIAALARRIGI